MIKRFIRKIFVGEMNHESPKSYIDYLEERGLIIGRTSKPTIHSHCIDGL